MDAGQNVQIGLLNIMVHPGSGGPPPLAPPPLPGCRLGVADPSRLHLRKCIRKRNVRIPNIMTDNGSGGPEPLKPRSSTRDHKVCLCLHARFNKIPTLTAVPDTLRSTFTDSQRGRRRP